MLVHWIWLAHRSGVSDRAKARLLECFSDSEDIYYADDYSCVPEISETAVQSLMDKSLDSSHKILEACAKEGLSVLTYRDASYPSRLRHIPDPPMVLYYKGMLPNWDGYPSIGIVGTRKPSLYGLTSAKRLGYQIAKCGGIVVSGLAFGIDGVAMQSALSAGGSVVGVLGCGADIVYPKANQALFADMERFGCILSEFAPGTEPFKYNFPKRNRIISGISNGVLVVEAPNGSGSLITARRALDQGREVFVVPGNIDVASFAGNFDLLRDGAIPVRNGWDVLEEYEPLYAGKLKRELDDAHQTAYPEEVERISEENGENKRLVAQNRRIPKKKEPTKPKKDKKSIDNGVSAPYSDVDKHEQALSDEEQKIVSAIGAEMRLVDDVIADSALPAHRVLALLTTLQIKGVVQKCSGNRVTLAQKRCV